MWLKFNHHNFAVLFYIKWLLDFFGEIFEILVWKFYKINSAKE